jgi:hypothetical protein
MIIFSMTRNVRNKGRCGCPYSTLALFQVRSTATELIVEGAIYLGVGIATCIVVDWLCGS